MQANQHTDQFRAPRADQSPREPDVIETASATTSPDNSNSGPFAYIIAGITVALSLMLALVFAGIASVVVMAIADDTSSSDAPFWLDEFDDLDDLDDYDSFEDWLDHRDNSSSGSSESNDARTSVADALNFDLAAYGPTIDDNVSASAYAGTPDEVRTFVRSFLAQDNDYADRLARTLDAAARNEDAQAAKLDEAYDLCTEAKDALAAVELPEVSNNAGEVRDGLGTAKDKALRRWELLASEIDLLRGGDINTNRLWDVDDDVLDATEEAAQSLVDAMAASH